MLRVLTIVGLLSCLATQAMAGGDDWRAIAVSGDVRVADSVTAIAVGTAFQNDVVIQTGARSQATFAREGRSLVVGPNARVHLSRDDRRVSVESGSAVIYRPGAASGERVYAGRSADLAVATHDSLSSNASEPSASGGNNRVPALPSLGALRAPEQRAMRPAAASYAATPAVRSGIDEHGSSRVTDAGLAARAPLTTGGEAAPTLRYSPVPDVDLPLPSGTGARFQLGSDGSSLVLSRKTDEQQLEALQGALSEVSRVPAIDGRAAENLLRKIRPDTETDRVWTERPKEIAKLAAIVMTVFVAAVLAIMGLIALWRSLRRPKASQAQPRWTTI